MLVLMSDTLKEQPPSHPRVQHSRSTMTSRAAAIPTPLLGSVPLTNERNCQ